MMYLLISIFITVYIGFKCYKTDEIYLLYVIKDSNTCSAINKILVM